MTRLKFHGAVCIPYHAWQKGGKLSANPAQHRGRKRGRSPAIKVERQVRRKLTINSINPAKGAAPLSALTRGHVVKKPHFFKSPPAQRLLFTKNLFGWHVIGNNYATPFRTYSHVNFPNLPADEARNPTPFQCQSGRSAEFPLFAADKKLLGRQMALHLTLLKRCSRVKMFFEDRFCC